MNEIAIGLGLLVAGVAIVFITWPWWTDRKAIQTECRPESQLARIAQDETLANCREAVLNALRDLDFDYAVSKVTAEDYGPLRQTLLVEAADIMAKLDGDQTATETKREASSTVNRSTVYSEQPVSNGSCPACGQTARPGAFYCPTCGTQLSLTCSGCGQTINPADLFCTSCGVEVALAFS